MHKIKSLFPLVIVAGLVFNILIGCSPLSAVNSGPENLTNTVQPSMMPSDTMTLPATQEVNASETPNPTVTVRPTLATTPTKIPTRTPYPNLTDDQARQLIRQLQDTNGGCDFPCWWGLQPGETSWKEGELFLEHLNADFRQGSGSVSTGTNFSIYFDIDGNGEEEGIAIVGVEKGVITGINLYPLSGTTINYRLDKLLTKYGKPQEIYIDTYPYSPEPPSLPFYLILYYPDVGISAFFDYNAVNLEDEILRVCPLGQPVSPEIKLWNPEEHLTIEDLYPWIPTIRYPFLTLSEATGMDISSFTKKFQKSNSTKCIDVAVDLY